MKSIHVHNVVVFLIWFSVSLERTAIETVEKLADFCSLIVKN